MVTTVTTTSYRVILHHSLSIEQPWEDVRELLRVMAALRDPATDCPWDLAQDCASIVPHTIEEAYEVAEAVERGEMRALCDELGDLLLQVVFYSQIAAERGVFDFEEVVSGLVEKLVRRHPHVFSDGSVRDVDGVWAQWEMIKRQEKAGTRHERDSALDGIPSQLPALQRESCGGHADISRTSVRRRCRRS